MISLKQLRIKSPNFVFQVQVLGTSSAIPTHARKLSAQVVTINDRHHLVDCGEGTQMQLLKYKIKLSRLDCIFITHLHGDHVLGLPGLLTSLALYERNFPLRLYAPMGLLEMLEVVFKQTHSHIGYELEFVPLEEFEPGEVIYQKDAYQVELLPLEHRVYCRGYLFQEINKKPKFDFYKAKALNIPNVYFSLLKQGNQVQLEDGRTIFPEDVLTAPDEALSYAYCSDTCYHEPLIEYVKGTKLLYHEATFLENLKKRAQMTYHSTAQEAATIAKKAAVHHLLLGHYSARYKDLSPLLDEAQAVFPNTHLAMDGHIYNLKEYV